MTAAAPGRIAGILFDKDGTLIDFRGTWDGWARDLIAEATGDDAAAAARLAAAMRFDLETGGFAPDSPIIAGTAEEAAALVAAGLGRDDVDAVERWIADRAKDAQMAPVVPLAPLCDRLRAAGHALGVATNDAEAVAHANLASLGLTAAFDFVAGFDSGHGGKPGPGMVTAFCAAMDLPPAACVMVGDSPHDLLAGRAAGARTVAVLTGISGAADLAPLADAVLPDIGHLPDWLGLAAATHDA
jgi:phosphoglycolate phosphatase